MYKLKAGLVGLLCLVGVAGCTTNNSIAPTVFSTNAVLQLSIGTLHDTANILRNRMRRTSPVGGGGTYLSAVSTFRNQFGNSAFESPANVQNATLSGPGVVGTINPTTSFDIIGSLFQYGQANGNNGIPGIPPAFNGTATCVLSSGVYSPCIDTGFLYNLTGGSPSRDVVGEAVSGGYTLNANVGVNGVVIPYTASATLPGSPIVLPNPCTLVTYTSDGPTAGGGTLHLTPSSPPSGVTERVLIIESAQGATSTIQAEVEASGSSATVPDSVGLPGGNHQVYCVGTDFPWIESGQPNNTAQAPPLGNGIDGTSNFSVSGFFTITQ
jgi:hypothetical protein